MEKFQELREKAKQRLKIADHMLIMTYPLVKDAKLLLAVTENLFLSFTNAMSALLYYERIFKRVPPFTDNFEAKFKLFKEKCMDRYKINPEILKTMREIKEIIYEHKKSPVEFVRKDRFVICSENYRMKTITIEQLKKYISKAKEFVSQIERILSKGERIFMKV